MFLNTNHTGKFLNTNSGEISMFLNTNHSGDY